MVEESRNANVVLTADVSSYSQEISGAERATNQLLTGVNALVTSVDRLTQSSGRSFQIVGAGTVAGLTAATTQASRFQSQLQQLNASATLSGRSFNRTESAVKSFRSEVNIGTGEIVGLFTQLEKLGQGDRPVGRLAEEFVKLGAVTGESIPTLTNSMVTLQKQMGTEGVENTRKYSATLSNLAANAGVSAEGIMEFSNAIAPVARVAEMSQTEIMGFSTAFQKSGQDGFTAANAFNQVVTDITRSIQFGGPELKAYSNLIGVTTEQFKEMPVAESVTQIFEEITKQGPEAIKTLERFGMDGMRTYKALATVADQGGFRQSLNEAEQGGSEEGMREHAEAATKALAGLEDQLGKLMGTLGRIGQSFGVGLLKPLEVLATALNTVLKPLASFMEALGNIPGLMTALGAGTMIAGGSLLRAFTPLSTLGAGVMLSRSGFTAGIGAGRSPDGRPRSRWARNVQNRMETDPTSRSSFQGRTYALGSRVGAFFPRGGGEGGAEGIGSRVRRGLSFGAAQGIHGLGWFNRMMLDPLRPSNVMDPTRREQMTRGWSSNAVRSRGWDMLDRGREGLSGARTGVRETVDRFRSGGGGLGGAGAAGAAAAGAAAASVQNLGRSAEEAAKGTARYTTATRALIGETRRLGTSLARAGAGTALMGAGAAGSMGMRGLGALGGMLGGPLGIGMMAGMGGMALWSSYRSKQEDTEELFAGDSMSAGSAYRVALGEAATATSDFASAVNQARNEIESGGGGDWDTSDPRSVTEADIAAARDPNVEYTDPRVRDMTEEQAWAFASGLYGESDQVVASAKGDLLMSQGDRDLVEKMLSQQAPDIAGLYSDANRQSWVDQWIFGNRVTTGTSAEQIALASGTSADFIASVPESQRASATIAVINESLLGINEIHRDKKIGDRAQTKHSVVQDALGQASTALGDDPETAQEFKDAYLAATRAVGHDDAVMFQDAFWGLFTAGSSPGAEAAREFREQYNTRNLSGHGAGTLAPYVRDQIQDPYRAVDSSGSGYTLEQLRETNLGAALFGSNQMPTSMLGTPGIPGTMQGISNEMFGVGNQGMVNPYVSSPEEIERQTRGIPVGDRIIEALTTQADNADFNMGTAMEMAAFARDSNVDWGSAKAELQELKESSDGVGTQFYNLIEQAESFAEIQHSNEMAYMSTEDRLKAMAVDLENARVHMEKFPESMTAAADFWEKNQAFEQERLQVHQRNLQIVHARREFDIAQERQIETASRQIGYQSSDFYKSRDRAEEDFERGLARSEASRIRSEGRAQRDFAIQTGRADEDFERSKSRQIEDFERSLARGQRDFNIQRERAEYEFNLSRERQDEDFNRQRERGYFDFTLQRERSEYDFNLQRERGEFDFNLTRKRSQEDFNLQRRRQEEDFNHQIELMAEQSARSIYNIYERVAVARTLSGQNMVTNMADQQRRMEEQSANLDIIRGLGLGNDAIQMLGLADGENAQQLARLIQDMMKDPELVAALNEMSDQRKVAAGNLITDEGNAQWEEMQRQYNLSVERASEDFQRGMDRQAADFERSLNRSRTDFDRGMRLQNEDFERAMARQAHDYNLALIRGSEDFNRGMTQQSEDFARGIADASEDFWRQMERNEDDFARMRARQIADFATSLADQREEYNIMVDESIEDWDIQRARQLTDFLTSNARMFTEMMIQQQQAGEDFSRSAEEITGSFEDIADAAATSLTGTAQQQFEGIRDLMDTTSGEVKTLSEEMVKNVNEIMDELGLTGVFVEFKGRGGGGGGGSPDFKAEGGTIEGNSPHPKADNIPIWATAGEFMQPVDSVQHYGIDTMEALRTKKIPKEALQGFADGGLIGGSKTETLINFGRHLRREGYHVGEHPLFGGVHPGAHLPTSRGGRHYIGQAIDVNYDGYGQAYENRMLDRIIGLAERLNLGYIWRSKGHYGHAHFDTATRWRLNDRMLRGFSGGPGEPSGDYFNIDTDDDGNKYHVSVFEKAKEKAGFKDWESLFGEHPIIDRQHIPDGIAKGLSMKMAEAIEEFGFGGDLGTVGGTPGGVERWRALVLDALSHVGQPAYLADTVLRRMNQESSGNPRAINLWDINAKNGVPSKGLMQVIDPTFRAYRDRSLANDVWNPFANIVASMNYALSRYGSLSRAYNRAGGYADGGLVTWHGEGGIFTAPRQIGVGERGPEMVLPLNNVGADFISEIMTKQHMGAESAMLNRASIPEVSKQITYHYSYDHSTTISGPITVESQDPNEMLRKLEAKKREAALIGRKP